MEKNQLCPRCQSISGTDVRACAKCGYQFSVPPAKQPCPKCQTPLEPAENFCAKCGFKIRATEEEKKVAADKQRVITERKMHEQKISTGRGWILAVAILTFISGFIFYFVNKSQVEKDIESVEKMISGMTTEERRDFEEKFKIESGGSTYEEAKSRDNNMVILLLIINIVLAGVYFGLWFWAKSNPFAAALIALIIYLTIVAINLVIDPKTVAQGLIFKIFVIIGLSSAVAAAYKYRKLQETNV